MSQVTGPSKTPKTSVGHGPQTKDSRPDNPDTKSQPSSGSQPSATEKAACGKAQVKRQNLKTSEDDIKIARENPNSFFAWGLALNPNLKTKL